MEEHIIKIVIPGENYDLEMHEPEPGKIAISLFNPEDDCDGGYIELPTKLFLDALRKAIPEMD